MLSLKTMYDLLLKEYIVHYSKGSSSKQADEQALGIVAVPKLSAWVILRMCHEGWLSRYAFRLESVATSSRIVRVIIGPMSLARPFGS
jgi:hypothetical protein